MNSNLHLSEDDLDEVLMGMCSPAVSAHLARCQLCVQRLDAFETAFRNPMSAFNEASLAWSQTRSNTISRDLAAHRPTPRLTLSAIGSSAAALVFTLALGLTIGMQHGAGNLGNAHPSIPRATAIADHSELHAQPEIADDNAMLAAINSAIVTPQPARFGLYEAADPAPPRRRAANRQVRD